MKSTDESGSLTVMSATFGAVIGEFVRALRGREPQRAFAARVKLSQSTVSVLESGSRPIRGPHFDKLLLAHHMTVAVACQTMTEIAKRLDAEEIAGRRDSIERTLTVDETVATAQKRARDEMALSRRERKASGRRVSDAARPSSAAPATGDRPRR